MKQNNKGFTLIEIMVIIVILAVLMAIAVPSVLKYADEGDKAQALDDAYACVSAAKYYGVRSYVNNDPITSIDSSKILNRAGAEGVVVDFTYNILENTLDALLYKSPKNIYVKFEDNKYEIVDMNASLTPDTADEILRACQLLADANPKISIENNGFSSGGNSRLLQNDYIAKYSGLLPLSMQEKELLADYTYTEGNVNELVWKPLYDVNVKIYLIVDTKKVAGAGQGPLIYYDGHYYYHRRNPTSTDVTNIWIQEGLFDLDLKEWILIK